MARQQVRINETETETETMRSDKNKRVPVTQRQEQEKTSSYEGLEKCSLLPVGCGTTVTPQPKLEAMSRFLFCDPNYLYLSSEGTTSASEW